MLELQHVNDVKLGTLTNFTKDNHGHLMLILFNFERYLVERYDLYGEQRCSPSSNAIIEAHPIAQR